MALHHQSLPFDYLVILDLEAYSDHPSDPHRPEIVELPWLVYDLATHSVVDHKQIYITPRWNTNPNPSPETLHAIPPDVAFAPSLADALHQFDSYLYNSFLPQRKSFCLLTDGHWDLSHFLYVEAARKALPLGPHFRLYFNLRLEFSKCYPRASVPHDRNAMFAFFDLPPPPPSSGIDECNALATIVTRLLHDGHIFVQPHVISDLDWASLPARFPPIATPVAAASPVGAVIRLRGLPYEATDIDVQNFLSGISIVPAGIHFVRNVQGKATGEAFVQLHFPDGVQEALRRDKHTVGRRYIEVFKSSPVDMANHLGRADARRQMYASAAIRPPRASNSHHSHVHGSSGNGSKRASRSGPSGNGGRLVVRVSGLGHHATADDVALLLEGVQIVGEGVVMVAGESGFDAFVEVASEPHVKKAIGRAGTRLPVRRDGSPDSVTYVTVDVRKSSLGALRTAAAAAAAATAAATAAAAATATMAMATPAAIGGTGDGREEEVEVSGEREGDGTGQGSSGRTGEGWLTVDGLADMVQQVGIIAGGETGTETRRDGQEGEVSKEEDEMGGGPGSGEREGADMEGGSRMVRMRGLPYSSGDEDIIAFFESFRIADGGIWRGKDRHGRPSGEACVTFATEEDARGAVATRDKAHMGNRYIELQLARGV